MAASEQSGRRPRTYTYGPEREQQADLLIPDGDGPHPLAVLLHGGFWRARFSRSLMAKLAVDLADRGWASWNVEYRRMGTGGGVVQTLQDVRAAIASLARLYAPVAADSVLLIGHSAGGQLALCASAMARVGAVVSLAGVCDLASAARERIGVDATVQFMGGTPEEQPTRYAFADPLRLLPTGVPSLLVHGDADDRVPVEQSRTYASAARAAGDRCELLELAGVDHFALIDPSTDAWAAVAGKLGGLLSG